MNFSSGTIEGIIFLLVIVFYIFRGIYRGLRRFFGMVRQALAPARGTSAEEVRRLAQQQMRQGPAQPPTARPAQPRTVPIQARRPEAGGPAVTDTATGGRFRAQMAEIEAQEAPGLTEAPSSARPTTEDVPALFRGGGDLVRAVILQEVLGKPLSQRRRGQAHNGRPTDSPQ